MKKIQILILFLAVYWLQLGCQKPDGLLQSEVDRFIYSVSSNTYSVDTIPNFEFKAIEYLLKAEVSFSDVFTNFLRNPASSVYFEGYGPSSAEFVLWTLERIRLFEGKYTAYSFPSLEPQLVKNNDLGIIPLNSEEVMQVWQLYKDWWEQSDTLLWSELRQIDPLDGSAYFWR